MKKIALITLGVISNLLLAHEIDPKQSTYTCEIYDSSGASSRPKQVVHKAMKPGAPVDPIFGVFLVREAFEWKLQRAR